MGNKVYKWVIAVMLISIAAFIYKLYSDFSEVDEAMQPIITSIPLHFEDVNQTIYIKTKVWGLLGDHSCIFLSDKENDNSIENKEILFENTIFYYKIQYPDSLFIFLPSMSYSEEKSINKTLGNVKIKITKFKASKNKEYAEKYEEMGLKKLNQLPTDSQVVEDGVITPK